MNVDSYHKKYGSTNGFWTDYKIIRSVAVRVDMNTMVEQTMKAIDGDYSTGAITWIKEHEQTLWGIIRGLEDDINISVIVEDEKQLAEYLEQYEQAWSKAIEAFKKGGSR